MWLTHILGLRPKQRVALDPVDPLTTWWEERESALAERRAGRPDRHARAIEGAATKRRAYVERDPLVLERGRA